MLSSLNYHLPKSYILQFGSDEFVYFAKAMRDVAAWFTELDCGSKVMTNMVKKMDGKGSKAKGMQQEVKLRLHLDFKALLRVCNDESR